MREQQAAKRAVREAKKRDGGSKKGENVALPTGARARQVSAGDSNDRVKAGRNGGRGGEIGGQDNSRGIPDAVVVTPANCDEMGNNTQQAAEPKSRQVIRTRAKEAKEVKVEPSGVAAPIASATETVAQPKRVLTVAQCSRSNPAAADSDDDSSVGDNLENWEGKPTVSWNEDTVTVVHRWSSSCSLNDDEDQVADLLEEHTANSVVESAVSQVIYDYFW